MERAADQVLPEPVQSPLTDGRKRKKSFDSRYLRRVQRRHFLLFDVLPFVGTAAAVGLLFVWPIGLLELGLLAGMYLATALGITAGYHRLFAHRTYKAAPSVRVVLTVLGSMAGQGPLISWVALHRRHHELSDRPGDPHSPNLASGRWARIRGLLHSHYTWMVGHPYPSVVHYAPDILRDRAAMRANRLYYPWVLLGLAIPTLIGGLVTWTWSGALLGFLWGGSVRMFVLENVIWSINSFLHMFGTRPFPTRENSRNSALLSVLSVGESWHNNHHGFPDSARFGVEPRQPDFGYRLIRLLELAGLAWDVRVPSAARVAQRKLKVEPENAPIGGPA